MKNYLIDKEIVEFAALKQKERKALFVVIAQMIIAVMTVLKVDRAELMEPHRNRGRKASEARHILMLLLYAETPQSKMSRQVIAEMFGYHSPVVQIKAMRKKKTTTYFAKNTRW